MRNLKRVLSLALAVVMVIGMMVMGAGAADFSDAAEIDYTEAVDVISALGIIEGIANGDDTYRFNPDGILTREGAAKLICYMMVGEENAKMLTATKTFSDVKATGWSAPYISYCVSLGYIAGNGDGTFNPEGKLTGLAFAKLLLCALGYDATIEGYVNNKNWATNIAADAFDAGLNIAGVDLNAQLTREQAAQMMLNAIKAPLVEYDTKGSSISVNGAEVVFGASKAEYVTSTLAMATRISNRELTNPSALSTAYTVEFGEKYMPNLFLTEGLTDEFGRPAHMWTYRTNDIGKYVDMDLLAVEYTTGARYSTVRRDIGYSTISNYEVSAFVDGVRATDATVATMVYNLKNSAPLPMTGTGNGVLTQIFVDHVKETITIVSINTYLAAVTADYNETLGYAPITIYTGYKEDVATEDTDYDLMYSDVFENAADLKANTFVKVTRAWDNVYEEWVVQSLEKAEIVPGVTISSYTNGADDTTTDDINRLSTLVADGEKYSTSKKACYDASLMYNYNVTSTDLVNSNFNLILDDYGYVLGLKKNMSKDPYVFVVGYESGSSVLAQAVDKALIITTDGVMKTVDISDSDPSFTDGAKLNLNATTGDNATVNAWFTYKLNADGVYVLTDYVDKQGTETVLNNDTVGGADISGTYPDLTYDNGTPGAGAAADDVTAYGNAKSTYIAVKADTSVSDNGSIVKVRGVTTGIKNTNIKADDVTALTDITVDTFFMYDNSNYVTCAVVIGDDVTTNSNMLYFASAPTGRHSMPNGEDDHYVTYSAILNGELTTVKVMDACASRVNPTEMQLFKAVFNSDGYIIELKGDVTSNSAVVLDDNEAYVATAAGVMNTTDNKINGYTLNSAPTKLELKGATLWVTTPATASNHVVIGDECAVFVKLDGSNKYTQFASVEAALGALTTGNYVQVTSVCDKVLGYAETLIIVEDKATATPAPAPTLAVDMEPVEIEFTQVGPSALTDFNEAAAAQNLIAIKDLAVGVYQFTEIPYINVTDPIIHTDDPADILHFVVNAAGGGSHVVLTILNGDGDDMYTCDYGAPSAGKGVISIQVTANGADVDEYGDACTEGHAAGVCNPTSGATGALAGYGKPGLPAGTYYYTITGCAGSDMVGTFVIK